MQMTKRMTTHEADDKIDWLMPVDHFFDAAFDFMVRDQQNLGLIEKLMVGGDVVYRLAPLGIITDRVPE
jgi:hypothetical protein